MNENIIVPPPPPSTLSSQIETGAGGVQTQITEKKHSDKGVYCWFFLQLYYIFYGSKGSKHLSGGGGCNFLYFFFLGGGVWGGGGYKSLFL